MTEPLLVSGTLTAADPGARTVSGVLLPYGTPGRTSVGRVTASMGTLTLPADPGDVTLNIEHDYTRPVGRASGLSDLDDGMHVTFRVAATRAGDDLLEEVREGLRNHLSVEVDNPVIRAGVLTGGQLTAAAAVVRPAFDGADLQLTATDTPTASPAQGDDSAGTSPTRVPPGGDVPAPDEVVLDGVRYRRVPDDDDQQDDDLEDTVPESPTMTAAAPRGAHPATPPDPERTYTGVTRLFADATRSHQLHAALSDITVSGAGSIGPDVIPPSWVGELWGGRAYVRRYVQLVTNAPLNGITVTGWRWVTKPEVSTYAGNKADVPSNTVDTEPVTASVKRLAGAHNVDRAYSDFGVQDFWDSYFRAMTESYAIKSDAAALAALVAGATPLTGTGLLADTTAWSMIVDGALAVVAAGGSPSFAVVGADLYREALLTPRDQTIALLTAALSLEDGSLEGFRIVPTADAAVTGKALVGARESATFYELAGSPIRVAAGAVQDVSRGGVDVGVFGYFASIVNDADTLVLVDKPLTATTATAPTVKR